MATPFVLYVALLGTGAYAAQTLSARERAITAEAYNLWSSTGDRVWPGASKTKIPILYIGQEAEYAIGFPNTLNAFANAGELAPYGYRIQSRPRTLSADLSASFPFEGVPAVVIGSPEALHKTLGEWVFTVEHEMFHVFQAANGEDEKIASLGIGARNDSSWHLNFPFPYTDADVLRLIHLQGYLFWLASITPDIDEASYNVGTALEAAQVYRARLGQLRPDGKAYRYSLFQEWVEGVAAYTEYKLAETAAREAYRPTDAYASLPEFQTYEELWQKTYQARPFLAKHAGRAAKDRNAFYHLGMAKALALDRVNPGWKKKYFSPSIWLDDLLSATGGN